MSSIHDTTVVYTCTSCDDYSTTCLECFTYHMQTGGADYSNAPSLHRMWACDGLYDVVPCSIHHQVVSEKMDDETAQSESVTSAIEQLMRATFNSGFPNAIFEYSITDGWKVVEMGEMSPFCECSCSWYGDELYKKCYGCLLIDAKIDMLRSGYPHAVFEYAGMYGPALRLVNTGPCAMVW